jgi:hypothetical protein
MYINIIYINIYIILHHITSHHITSHSQHIRFLNRLTDLYNCFVNIFIFSQSLGLYFVFNLIHSFFIVTSPFVMMFSWFLFTASSIYTVEICKMLVIHRDFSVYFILLHFSFFIFHFVVIAIIQKLCS